MPKKQPVCDVCKKKLQLIEDGRYAHKKKEHWADRPHPARPVKEV